MIRPPLLALSCCALVAGCSFFAPVAEELHKSPNPFGTPFQNQAEMLEHIPLGTPIEKVKTEMCAHGFAEWSSQRQTDQVTLTFHLVDLGGLREDRFATIYCQQGVVVDIRYDLVKPGDARFRTAMTDASLELGRQIFEQLRHKGSVAGIGNLALVRQLLDLVRDWGRFAARSGIILFRSSAINTFPNNHRRLTFAPPPTTIRVIAANPKEPCYEPTVNLGTGVASVLHPAARS